MADWEQKFDQDTLDRGRASYLNHRVDGLEETDGGCRGAVLGRQRFEVSVKLREGSPVRMSCSCPAAKCGRNCEHMAAVLYALEAKRKAWEEQIQEAELMKKWRQMDEELRLEEEKKKAEKQNTRDERQRKAMTKRRLKEEKEAEERRRLEEEQMAEARRIQEEKEAEARRIQEEKEAEARRIQEEKEAELRRIQEQEREVRRAAREKRKEEKARREEERKQKAEEQRRIEEEKRVAEEARREKIRQQKAEDARRRAEKRQKEQEAQRLAEQKRAEEEQSRLELVEMMQEDASDTGRSNESIASLERYSYFNGSSIRKSLKISKSVFEKGKKLREQGMLALSHVVSGYEWDGNHVRGRMEATGAFKNEDFPVRISFSRTEVREFECGCPKCRRAYYSWYGGKTDCEYVAGALLMLEEYLATHNIADATDKTARMLIGAYQEKRANRIVADTFAKEESLKLVPRLTRKGDELSLSFKIGEGRLFIIKKLSEFCRNVKNSATATYGSSTQINHSLSNFTEEGKKWIHLISRMVREEEDFQERMIQSRDYYGNGRVGVGGALHLSGWRLDEFYRQMGDTPFEYEDKDADGKKKRMLTCAKKNPRVSLCISSEKSSAQEEFHGVRVTGILPGMYHGTDTAYYIEDDHLNRIDREMIEKIEPLENLAVCGAVSFYVGRNHMAEFYYKILPLLQDIANVTETEPERFRSYLPPEAEFFFYLDAEDQNVTCRISVRYGDKSFSGLDLIRKQETGGLEPFRDGAKEEEVLYQALQLLPEIDYAKDELHCGSREELVYTMMESGAEKLMELGEVRCTKRFLGNKTIRRVKVSVGVSVSSDLLELNISTEDIPQSELLDLLAGYRAKKKYYRMKDGSFVNLEDSSLEMLSELMDAMHLKPKEFVKGKMHIPMYRTLYLDKMLEENDSVYSSRDSRFREVVKGFKTVKDADFEEPESLSKIMRKYQKNGYKWLRTLEAWNFGGILADDMGLGKTLQIIAVLLAAKQEGKEGTSLVVAPASLVFNWGEEFERFAPELKISLIAGNQEERRKKLEAWQESDVLVTSYDLLKRDILCYEDKQFLYEIIDEAQYIKNQTTAAAKAVKIVKSRTRFALTGTPIENRLSELWSIFDYLMPGFLYSYDVFKREIETPIVKSEDENAMKRLQKMAGPFILRRLKEDVLKDLPEKLEESRYVRLEDTQQKLYDAQVVKMREMIARQNQEDFNKNKLVILAQLTRLRQICCDPSLCFENYKGDGAKREACMQLIQSAIDGGHRMLVFSQFTSMLEILKQDLDKEGISYYTITGSTSKEKRLQMVKEFNEGDTPVFLISLKAGGVGLNLTGADVVIHYDPWWNLAVQNQATDRAHRIGQTKKVTVYKLIAKNTIEEKIQNLQETKKNLAEQVIGGETGQLGSLSREEILDLLEL